MNKEIVYTGAARDIINFFDNYGFTTDIKFSSGELEKCIADIIRLNDLGDLIELERYRSH
jgi:hypothetical protein